MEIGDEEAVRRFVLRELLRDEDIDLAVNEPIFSSGLLDSFSVVQLICFLEDRFGLKIPVADVTIEDFDTITRALRVVAKLQASQRGQ